MATVVRAMGDGAFLGEYFDGTRRYYVVMRARTGIHRKNWLRCPWLPQTVTFWRWVNWLGDPNRWSFEYPPDRPQENIDLEGDSAA